MNILYINTAQETSEIALIIDGVVADSHSWQSEKRLGDDLLPAIANVLKRQSIDLHNLGAIAVFPGPGSFTGTRVGVGTANALAWSLNVPVLAWSGSLDDLCRFEVGGKRFEQIVVPVYGSEPSVTLRS